MNHGASPVARFRLHDLREQQIHDASVSASLDDPPTARRALDERAVHTKEMIYPLVITHIAIENDHRNSRFSHQKW